MSVIKKGVLMILKRCLVYVSLCAISLTLYSMEHPSDPLEIHNKLIDALNTCNPDALQTVVSDKNFDPHITIDTQLGPLNPLVYLVFQQFPDSSKTYACVDILHKAHVPIKEPSEQEPLTIFSLVNSEEMLTYLTTKIYKEKSAKEMLEIYFSKVKYTLFQNMCSTIIPSSELKKIYNTYNPRIDQHTVANGNILHSILFGYLAINLSAQIFRASSVKRVNSISEHVFNNTINYDYVNETYEKYIFFANNAAINLLEKNGFNQLPYQFYIFLLRKLYHNDSPNDLLQDCLISSLFDLRNRLNNANISTKRFYTESLALAKLIAPHENAPEPTLEWEDML